MSHRLQVLISPDLDARLRKAAQRKGVSKGEWVRSAIEQSLATNDVDPLQRLGELQAPTADIQDMLAEIESGRS
jgi:hypothetical protein